MPIVITFWSLALLSAIAISLSFMGNVSYRLAQNSFRAANADAVADAAVNRAVLALLDPRTDIGHLLNGGDQRWEFGGAAIRIRVQDELGKIDLNQTDASTLVSLFQSAGIEPMAAEALADKVLDWRGNTPLKRANGPKAQDYGAAGLDYRPRKGPFQSVDELTLVMGVTHELYKRVAPAVTVYSGRQFVDPRFAPPEVLLALPSLANAHAAAVAQSQGATAAALILGGQGSPMAALKGRAFAVDTEISQSSAVVRRHNAVRLTGSPAEPFWLLIRQRS